MIQYALDTFLCNAYTVANLEWGRAGSAAAPPLGDDCKHYSYV